MHHTITARTARARRREVGSEPHSHRLLNRAMGLLLRSPLHGVASAEVMLLAFTGRRSGRTFTTPVSYLRNGDSVCFFTTRRWWRNLEGGAPVTLRLGGRRVRGFAVPTTAPDRVARAIREYLERKGRRNAFRIDLELADARRQPTEAELLEAARSRVVVDVWLERTSTAREGSA